MELTKENYIFTDNKELIKLDEVQRLLKQSHWAVNRSVGIIESTIESSICFMIFHDTKLIGFARVISDLAVYSLILDVIIDEQYRGKGLGTKLIEFINNYPKLINTSKVLWTKYAKNLYEKSGYIEEDCYTLMFNRTRILNE